MQTKATFFLYVSLRTKMFIKIKQIRQFFYTPEHFLNINVIGHRKVLWVQGESSRFAISNPERHPAPESDLPASESSVHFVIEKQSRSLKSKRAIIKIWNLISFSIEKSTSLCRNEDSREKWLPEVQWSQNQYCSKSHLLSILGFWKEKNNFEQLFFVVVVVGLSRISLLPKYYL